MPRWSRQAVSQLRHLLGGLRRGQETPADPVLGPVLMPRLRNVPRGMGRMCYIGKPDTAHSPHTWETYELWELHTSTTQPTKISPTQTVEVYNDTGQTLSTSVMHIIWEVDSDSSNVKEKHVCLPLELEACI